MAAAHIVTALTPAHASQAVRAANTHIAAAGMASTANIVAVVTASARDIGRARAKAMEIAAAKAYPPNAAATTLEATDRR